MAGDMLQRIDDVIEAYEVIDEPPKELQAIVEMAAFVARVPLATVNVITSTEQHQVATIGFPSSICRREDSMCALSLTLGGQVVVPDASSDPRFSANPFVDGRLGEVRFYAAQPLISPDDVAVGTLCVFDTEPRELDETQKLALSALAGRIVDILELSRRTRALDDSLRRMADLRDELVRSNEHLAAFAGQVSHDLRNPLSTVAMSLYLLQEEFVDEDRPADLVAVERALRGTKRMQALIEDLLAFARVGGTLRRTQVDLRAEVDAMLADLARVLAGAHVEVGELPTVSGDRTQLRAVLQNLVANAAKFRLDGRPAEITISARRDGEGWRVEVSDRGRGIAEADVERVFEPLVRLDEAADGSGIGLATCRRVMQAHGGRIGLDPREGGGTTAWVWLPDA
ncbi:ATP-binding protein [Nocardioides zeae]|uniref:Sensor-like histidine kinase SenX3 n=1 Tax=Nocardioides imazamoxiresistens TaxID=3231893 RepID=A0ABU3PX53_9ACTN|nr:ATP-binding protein [Nocardioides zeae]MDT9593822.1 ATP-binding protein [Nocardioides zeae]